MAGEIQLNSTTMATESSGSITAELDTIRPNTTNGSLTLQGDSSNAGVTGLTIDSSGNATFAGTANNLGTVTAGTISGGTIGSSVVFPSGVLIDFDHQVETGTVSKTTSGDHDTPVIAGGTQISITVPDGCTAIMTAAGGKAFGSTSGTRRNSICTIVYSTSGSDVTTSDTQIIGAEILDTSSTDDSSAGYVSGSYSNSTGSDVTLKWRWAVKGLNSSGFTGLWYTASARANISLQTLIFRT